MKEKFKGIVLGIIIGVMLVPAVFATVGTVTKELHYNDIKIKLDGAEITPKDANGNVIEPFIIDGTTYLPVRGVADALGLGVQWDAQNNTVLLGEGATSGDGPSGNVTKIGDVVYDANGVKVTLTDIKESSHSYEYRFLLENNNDYEVSFIGNDISVDDFMISLTNGVSFNAEAHKKAVSVLTIGKYDLEQNGTGSIEKIDMNTTCGTNDGSGYKQYKGTITIYQ